MRATLYSRAKERLIYLALLGCGVASILVTIGIVGVLIVESAMFFQEVPIWDFLTGTVWTPLYSSKQFGVLPLVCGTVVTATIGVIFALPVGLLIAIYLSEYASARTRNWVKPVLELLAGVPTIVFGYFALLALTPVLQSFIPGLEGFNALSAGLAIGVMILPMIATLSESAIFAVPLALKDAAYALGATRFQIVIKVLIPAALGGISAAVILALARATGETMIVAIAAGQQPRFSLNPLVGLETMTAYIVQVSLGDTPHGTIEYHTIFAVGLLLFLITLILNSVSIKIRNSFQMRGD